MQSVECTFNVMTTVLLFTDQLWKSDCRVRELCYGENKKDQITQGVS